MTSDKKRPMAYIAGPMRGIEDYNFPAFRDAAVKFWCRGYDVFNPAEHECGAAEEWEKNGRVGPFPIHTYMETDLPAVCRADVVFVLDGWEKSQGASLEVHVARALGKEVRRADTMELIDENKTETVLEEAMRITSEDRNKHYGHPRDNFNNTAAAWTAYLRGARKLSGDVELEGRDVGMLMIILKAMRDANMAKRDNITDICGYARCIERLDEEVE